MTPKAMKSSERHANRAQTERRSKIAPASDGVQMGTKFRASRESLSRLPEEPAGGNQVNFVNISPPRALAPRCAESALRQDMLRGDPCAIALLNRSAARRQIRR